MIYLRNITDSRGDVVEYLWYCSQSCYVSSFIATPTSQTIEQGGAYPLGAEHDGPDCCAECGDPIGNPLTEHGEAYVVEYVSDTLIGSLADTPQESVARARALFEEYRYLFEPYKVNAILRAAHIEDKRLDA